MRPVPCHRRRNCWSRGRELNPRPTDYESVALPLSYPGIPRGYERGRLDLITSVGACDRLVDQAERSEILSARSAYQAKRHERGLRGEGDSCRLRHRAKRDDAAGVCPVSPSRLTGAFAQDGCNDRLGGRRSGICRHSAAGVENAAKPLLFRNRQTLSVRVQTGGHPGASFGSPAYAPLVRLGTKGTVVPALKSVTCGLAVARRECTRASRRQSAFRCSWVCRSGGRMAPRSQSVATRLLHFQVWKQ